MKAYDGISRLQYRDTHHIYVIKHPITHRIFYVGQTRMEPEYRLKGHIYESKREKVDSEKCKLIRDILDLGIRPIIESIEKIETFSYLDTLEVNLREKFWIDYYQSIGCNLLNIVGIKTRMLPEYETYEHHLKEGSVPTKYYYCGSDHRGNHFYDKQRIIADGLVWRGEDDEPKPRETRDDFKENPPRETNHECYNDIPDGW